MFKVLQGTVQSDVDPGERTHRRRRAPAPDRRRCGARSTRPPRRCRRATSPRWPSSHRRPTGDVLGTRGAEIEVEPLEAPEPTLADRDHREVQGRRGQARERTAPPPGRGPRDPDRAQRGDAPDAPAGHGRDAPRDRARAPGAQVRRRGDDRGHARRVSRDDHGDGRSRGPLQEAERRPRPVRRRVPPRRAARARLRASSSRTRSSAARSRASSSPRSRRASRRRWPRAACTASRSWT